MSMKQEQHAYRIWTQKDKAKLLSGSGITQVQSKFFDWWAVANRTVKQRGRLRNSHERIHRFEGDNATRPHPFLYHLYGAFDQIVTTGLGSPGRCSNSSSDVEHINSVIENIDICPRQF